MSDQVYEVEGLRGICSFMRELHVVDPRFCFMRLKRISEVQIQHTPLTKETW